MEAKELEKKKASTSRPSWDKAGFSLISPINRQNKGQNKGARGRDQKPEMEDVRRLSLGVAMDFKASNLTECHIFYLETPGGTFS